MLLDVLVEKTVVVVVLVVLLVVVVLVVVVALLVVPLVVVVLVVVVVGKLGTANVQNDRLETGADSGPAVIMGFVDNYRSLHIIGR